MRYDFAHKAIRGVIACIVAACLPVYAQDMTLQVVKIGFVGALGKIRQGNLSFSARDGAQMAVDEANLRKIVIGGQQVRFELLVRDDQSDVNFARIAANALVAAGVVGVVGHNTTDTSIAAAPVYNEAGVPMISPMSTGRQLTLAGYRNVFQLLGHSDISGVYLAQLSGQTIKARRIAVVDNATALGVGLGNAYIGQIRRDGGDILFRESISSKTSDFNAVLSRAKQEKADLLFFTGTGAQAVAFSENFQRVGVPATLLLTGGGVNSSFPDAEAYPEGAYLLLQGMPVESRPGYAQFEKSYRKKFDSSLNPYAMFSYDAVGMLIEAFRKAGNINPKIAVNELHAMEYKGISGPVSFAVDGSQNNPPYTLYRASKKKWQVVKTFGR